LKVGSHAWEVDFGGYGEVVEDAFAIEWLVVCSKVE
jgi:hypothetical protein